MSWKKTKASEEKLSSLAFVQNDSSNTAIYCSCIYINLNGTVVLVHSNVTNTINMWFSLNLRSNKKHRTISSRRYISSILARRHCSSILRVFRTGNKQLVPDSPAEWNTSLFEGSHSVDTYNTKAKFPSPLLSWCYPLQKDTVLYTGLTCTHGTCRKINRVHLNINHPAFCLNSGATAQLGPGWSCTLE